MQYVLLAVYVSAFVILTLGQLVAALGKDRRSQMAGIGAILLGIAVLLIGILSVLADIAQAL